MPGSSQGMKMTTVTAAANLEFHHSLRFPCTVAVGIRVSKIGRTSIVLTIGIFDKNDLQNGAAVLVRLTNVCVEDDTVTPKVITQAMKDNLAKVNPYGTFMPKL